MTRETIEKAGRDYALDQLEIVGLPGRAEAMKAFVAGADWLADYLCKIPFKEIIDELHEYCANELKENSYDTGKCI